MLTYNVNGTNVPILPPLTNHPDVPPYFEGKDVCYFGGKTLSLTPSARQVLTELVRGAPHPVKILTRISGKHCTLCFRSIQMALRLARVPWHVRRFRGIEMIAVLEKDGTPYLKQERIRDRRRAYAAKLRARGNSIRLRAKT